MSIDLLTVHGLLQLTRSEKLLALSPWTQDEEQRNLPPEFAISSVLMVSIFWLGSYQHT